MQSPQSAQSAQSAHRTPSRDPEHGHPTVEPQAASGSLAVCLDDAAQVDANRRSAAASLYLALLESLSAQDQRWVLEVITRHREAEREAEQRGEPLPGPAW